jgi:uncharacterized protein with PIN domain
MCRFHLPQVIKHLINTVLVVRSLNLIQFAELTMSKPNKKAPESSVDIYCNQCKTQLFKYRKGRKGALVKCFKQRITKDFTTIPCTCPTCRNIFARDTLIRGTPAYKLIGGKVFSK